MSKFEEIRMIFLEQIKKSLESKTHSKTEELVNIFNKFCTAERLLKD